MLRPPGGGRQLFSSAQLKLPTFRSVPATYADVLATCRQRCKAKFRTKQDSRKTKSLGEGSDLAAFQAERATVKMTPQRKKNLPKEGEFDGHVA